MMKRRAEARRYVAMEIDAQKRRKEVKTVGNAFRVRGKVRSQVYHFRGVEVDGVQLKLEDTALITPGEDDDIEKLQVAIIKDITQVIKTGKVMTKVQWLYRPEQAKKEGGGSWVKEDSRLLYYSFQYTNIAAESLMHPCMVHFLPWYNGLLEHRKHPGFIVKSLYDDKKKKLVKLADALFDDERRKEIYPLIRKTMERLGNHPNLKGEDVSRSYRLRVEATEKLLREKREISHKKVLSKDEGPSMYHAILLKSGAITSEKTRNHWREKILQALERGCIEGGNKLIWPDSAVAAAVSLEKACKETRQNVSAYNLKMRSLEFNLKKNTVLARRFLKMEIGPLILLEMGAVALKEGLTPEEIARNRREEPLRIQMTDARCRICTNKNVGIVSVARAGCTDRYMLECQDCGRSWYASRDEFSTVATKPPNDTPSATP